MAEQQSEQFQSEASDAEGQDERPNGSHQEIYTYHPIHGFQLAHAAPAALPQSQGTISLPAAVESWGSLSANGFRQQIPQPDRQSIDQQVPGGAGPSPFYTPAGNYTPYENHLAQETVPAGETTVRHASQPGAQGAVEGPSTSSALRTRSLQHTTGLFLPSAQASTSTDSAPPPALGQISFSDFSNFGKHLNHGSFPTASNDFGSHLEEDATLQQPSRRGTHHYWFGPKAPPWQPPLPPKRHRNDTTLLEPPAPTEPPALVFTQTPQLANLLLGRELGEPGYLGVRHDAVLFTRSRDAEMAKTDYEGDPAPGETGNGEEDKAGGMKPPHNSEGGKDD